jgi:voltage-gated potassium channel
VVGAIILLSRRIIDPAAPGPLLSPCLGCLQADDPGPTIRQREPQVRQAGRSRVEEGSASMSTEVIAGPERSNAYSIFILVLTVLSLVIMVALVLPLDQATSQLLTVYDNVICGVFLIDFFLNLRRSHPKGEYLIKQRGWLDLLGSIPTLGFFQFTALLRLARLSRLARIARLLRGRNKKQLVQDVARNRGEYAAFITILLAFLVLTLSSVLVLQFESKSPDANITTGGDALWWAVVTITTVGYAASIR